MNVNDAYKRIVFKIGTPDDSSGRALNPRIPNQYILYELYDQLKSYANITKGIQDVHSFYVTRDINFMPAPPLALRSQGYYYAYIISNGVIFPMDFRGSRDVFNNFRVNPVNGISNWIMPWNMGHTQYMSVFPANSINPKSVLLTDDITENSATLMVSSTDGFVNNNGRILVGAEKILYAYKDSTRFYDCVRGLEQTTASVHNSLSTVSETNMFVFYSRLPEDITIDDSYNNVIPNSILTRVLEPCDEHMEGIIKATAYNLLLKIDMDMAEAHKIDSTILYEEYKKDIQRGYARNRMNVNIRQPFAPSEMGIPYGTNLMY